MNINYSTAKTILFFYRKKQRTKEPNAKDPNSVCGVAKLEEYHGPPMEYSLVICEGGDEIAHKTQLISLDPPETKQRERPVAPQQQWKIPNPMHAPLLPPQTNQVYYTDSFNQLEQMTKRLLLTSSTFAYPQVPHQQFFMTKGNNNIVLQR